MVNYLRVFHHVGFFFDRADGRGDQDEVCQDLEALRSDVVSPGDEAPLILEDGLNRELDKIGEVLAENDRWELGGEG